MAVAKKSEENNKTFTQTFLLSKLILISSTRPLPSLLTGGASARQGYLWIRSRIWPIHPISGVRLRRPGSSRRMRKLAQVDAFFSQSLPWLGKRKEKTKKWEVIRSLPFFPIRSGNEYKLNSMYRGEYLDLFYITSRSTRPTFYGADVIGRKIKKRKKRQAVIFSLDINDKPRPKR